MKPETSIMVIIVLLIVLIAALVFTFLDKECPPLPLPRALVVCPGETPFITDNWELNHGTIVVKINDRSLALPHTCGLVWPAP